MWPPYIFSVSPPRVAPPHKPRLVFTAECWWRWSVGGRAVKHRNTLTRLHLSWSVSEHSTRSRREGNKGREAILQHNAQLFIHHSRGLSTGMSLWIFDKDIEVQRLQLRGFIITFVAIYASSRWAERKNNKSKATEPRREPSEPITCVSCYCTLVTELQSNGDDEFDGRFDLKL